MKKKKEIISHSPEETRELAQRLGALLPEGCIIAAHGDLGAGKTLFAAGLAAGLNIQEPVVSPTFIFFQQYQGRLGFSHIDAYRLEGLEDEDIALTGVDEALAWPQAAFVEWPQFLAGHLPANHINLTIDRCPESEDWRRLSFEYQESEEWLDEALSH